MDLVSAIKAFNAASEQKIEFLPVNREGHMSVRLPRTGRTIRVMRGVTDRFPVRAEDIVLLCQEARRAAAPGLALLAAALDGLADIDMKIEDEDTA